jgi:hypothetical protein
MIIIAYLRKWKPKKRQESHWFELILSVETICAIPSAAASKNETRRPVF